MNKNYYSLFIILAFSTLLSACGKDDKDNYRKIDYNVVSESNTEETYNTSEKITESVTEEFYQTTSAEEENFLEAQKKTDNYKIGASSNGGVIIKNSLLFDNIGIAVNYENVPMFTVCFTVENISNNSIMFAADDYGIGINGKSDYDIEWWTNAELYEIDNKCNAIADVSSTDLIYPNKKYLAILSFTGTETQPFSGNNFNNYIGYELFYSGSLNNLGCDKILEFNNSYVIPQGQTYQQYAGFE